jgi:hypothetical protein
MIEGLDWLDAPVWDGLSFALGCFLPLEHLLVTVMNALLKSLLFGCVLGAASAPACLPAASLAAEACKVSKEFHGAAPSVIVQDALSEKFQHPLKRVDCRDNGLCYQRWGKDCSV